MNASVSRQRTWQRRNPAKTSAHRIVTAAISGGQLMRPAGCERCGVTCVPHGHHPDYLKPLAVEWLCRACHGKQHRGFASDAAPATSVRLEPEQIDALRRLARREKRSVGNTIRVLIGEALVARGVVAKSAEAA